MPKFKIYFYKDAESRKPKILTLFFGQVFSERVFRGTPIEADQPRPTDPTNRGHTDRGTDFGAVKFHFSPEGLDKNFFIRGKKFAPPKGPGGQPTKLLPIDSKKKVRLGEN